MQVSNPAPVVLKERDMDKVCFTGSHKRKVCANKFCRKTDDCMAEQQWLTGLSYLEIESKWKNKTYKAKNRTTYYVWIIKNKIYFESVKWIKNELCKLHNLKGENIRIEDVKYLGTCESVAYPIKLSTGRVLYSPEASIKLTDSK